MTWYEGVGLLLALVGAWASGAYLLDRFLPHRKVSWRRAQRAARQIASKLVTSKFDPTLIVGIGRGGAIMGAMVSGCLGHRPLLVVDRQYRWVAGRRTDDLLLHMALPDRLVQRVLLVAGEAHSGNTMRLYHDYLRGLGAERIARAALYVQKGCTEPIEYYGLTGRKDLRMPWMFPKEYARESLSAEESGSLHVRDEGSSYGAGHLTLFVVRHGESTDNAGVDRYSGIRDCGLSDVGLEQARRVGRYLQSVGVQRIVASPMKRALSTAREIERLTGAPVVVDERLREMDFGRWEGLTREEVREKWASQFSGNRMNPIAVPIPGGEPAESVLARIRDFLDDVDASPARDGISRIALVTHNTLARILVGHCQGTPIENYRDIRIDNASVSKIRIGRGGVFRVLTSNQTEHLRE